MNDELKDLLEISSAQHGRLCPKQVLGVRMAMLAGNILGISLPQSDKRLLTIVETDGCTADGIIAGTGCSVGHRTLRIEDYGKVAATFVDTVVSMAIRIAPGKDIRRRAYQYAPTGSSKWETYLIGYQKMPDDLLFSVTTVVLKTPTDRIISRAGLKAICTSCGEEIINGRELTLHGKPFCHSCGSDSYYSIAGTEESIESILCHQDQ